MSKDPALMLYTRDFYEGTRTMTPEERACYLDLLIYQHNKGIIPDDPTRLSLYCSGCSVEVVQSVLNQKFNHLVDGWSNHRLADEMKKRSTSQPKKLAASVFAGLISKRKLKKGQKEELKSRFEIEKHITEENGEIKDDEAIKASVRFWFNTIVNQEFNQMVDQKVNQNTIEDATVIVKKDLPYPSEDFANSWSEWIQFRQDQHGFKYRSFASEEKALMGLHRLAGDSEALAIQIINRSIANGWKGLFKLKEESKTLGEKIDKSNRTREIVDKIT